MAHSVRRRELSSAQTAVIYVLSVTWLSMSWRPHIKDGCVPCMDAALQEVSEPISHLRIPAVGYGNALAKCIVTRRVKGRRPRTVYSRSTYSSLYPSRKAEAQTGAV